MNSLTLTPLSRRLGLAFALLGLLLFAGSWLHSGQPTTWPKLADDAFYYFQVAENVANGHGFSMDRLNFTNGFQPLWMLLLTGLYALHPEPLTVAPALVVLLMLLLAGVTVALLHDWITRFAGQKAATLSVLLLLFPRYLNVLLGGLEAGLVVLLVAATLRQLTLQPDWLEVQPQTRDAKTGFLLGLLMLARLDAVWLLFALAGAVTLRGLRAQDLPMVQRLLRIALKGLSLFWPVLLLVLPYLAWNQAMTGHLVPISGVLKSSFPHAQWNGHYLLEHKDFYALIVLTLLAAMRTHEAPVPVRWTLRALAVGVAIHALYTLFFMHWAVFAWHYAVALGTGIASIGWLLRAVETQPPRRQLLIVATELVLLVVSLTYSLTKADTSFVPSALKAGDWARENLPKNAILGMKDSGAFTWQSRHQVVNLDGVINGYPYQNALCHGQLRQFLQGQGVTYIAQHAVPVSQRGQDVEQLYPCHLPGGQPGKLRLLAKDVVYRGEPYGPEHADEVVIFKVDLR